MGIGKALDSLVATFSPQRGLKRWHARQVLSEVAKFEQRSADRRRERSHEAGAISKRTEKWKASGASPNQETQPRRALIRNRSRQLIRDNPWATNACEIWESEIVGTGIRPEFRHEKDGVVQTAKDLWKEHCESTKLDADGKLTIYGQQSLLVRTIFESGELLVRRRRRRLEDGLPLPFQIELLEPEHLDEFRDISRLQNGGFIRGGIQFGAFGQREGYWMFPDHPGELAWIGQASKLVSASEILHPFKVQRPKQVRGVPALASVMIMLRDLDAYTDAELVKQHVAACLTAFVTDSADTGDPDTTATKKPLLPEELEPGAIAKLPAGAVVSFSNPPRVEAFDKFMRGYLRAAAAGSGITYEGLTGDWQGVTYSSARIAFYQNSRAIERFRWNVIIAQFLDPLMEWFVTAAQLTGELPIDGLSWTWTPPRRQVLDPKNEVPARRDMCRAGFTSPSELMREDGLDPDEVWEEAKRDYQRMKELGLAYECDPSVPLRGGPAPAAKGEAAPEKPAPEEEPAGDDDEA